VNNAVSIAQFNPNVAETSTMRPSSALPLVWPTAHPHDRQSTRMRDLAKVVKACHKAIAPPRLATMSVAPGRTIRASTDYIVVMHIRARDSLLSVRKKEIFESANELRAKKRGDRTYRPTLRVDARNSRPARRRQPTPYVNISFGRSL